MAVFSRSQLRLSRLLHCCILQRSIGLLAVAVLLSGFPVQEWQLIAPGLAQTSAPTVEDLIREGAYLNQEGRDAVSRGQFQEALKLFQKALALFQQAKAPAGVGTTLNNIGNVYHYNLGQFEEAQKYYQQALAQQRAASYREGEWAVLDDLGELSVALQKYDQALQFFRQALAIVRELKDPNSEAIRLDNIANVQFQLGQFPETLATYQQALVIYRANQNYIDEAITLTNVGVIYVNLGQYAQALNSYETALKLFNERVTTYKGAKATLLNNMAGLYYGLGQYDRAQQFSQEALQILNRFNDLKEGSPAFGQSRVIHDTIGQGSRPLDLAVRSVASTSMRQEGLVLRGQAATLNNLGQMYTTQGKPQEALKLHQQALKIYQEARDSIGEATTLNYVGNVYSVMGQYDRALQSYQQALATYQKLRDRSGEGMVLSNIAQSYQHQKQLDKAIQAYRQALTIQREVGDRPTQSITLTNLGQAFLAQGDLEAADQSLADAIQVLESLRPGLSDSSKVSLFERQAWVYELRQQVLVNRQQTETALEVAEQGRARAFVELLARRLAGSSQAGVAPPPPITRIRQVAKEQNTTLVQYSVLQEESAQGTKQPSRLLIWVVSPTGVVSFRQVDLKQQGVTDLEKLVADSRRSIGVRGRGLSFQENAQAAVVAQQVSNLETQNASLQRLYRILIEPVADLLPKDDKARVTFIPQGALFLVPFPALQDRQGRYLIQQHTILTAPAIQVLELTRQQRDRIRKLNLQETLVLGNPTMPKIRAQLGDEYYQLTSLPGAEREAKQIASLLKVPAVTGSEGTETLVRNQFPRLHWLHLATHGLLDDIRGEGMPGAIALAPDNQQDGLLTSSEILGLTINAELVVLSACDTGGGKITGDGVIGLSRSVLSAGAASVIVSLWQVPDAPTAALMTQLYENLQKGLDRAQALRQAMLTTQSQYPDPRDWAAFTLIGESN